MEPDIVVIIATKLWTALAEESRLNPKQRFALLQKAYTLAQVSTQPHSVAIFPGGNSGSGISLSLTSI